MPELNRIDKVYQALQGFEIGDLSPLSRFGQQKVTPKYTLLGMHAGRRTFICNALSLDIPPQVVMK